MKQEMSIAKSFPPKAGEKEFWTWVKEETRKKYPEGKIIAKFKVEPLKNSVKNPKNLVTATITIEKGS